MPLTALASPKAAPTGYVGYFGMHRMPFDTAPNPDFAFATRAHEIALLRMQDSVEQRMGLALLKGDIGTGKSTLSPSSHPSLGRGAGAVSDSLDR